MFDSTTGTLTIVILVIVSGLTFAGLRIRRRQRLHKSAHVGTPRLQVDPAKFATLTPREREVAFLWVIQSLTRKEIAAKLHVDPETVSTHIKNIYKRLDVHSRTELARYIPYLVRAKQLPPDVAGYPD